MRTMIRMVSQLMRSPWSGYSTFPASAARQPRLGIDRAGRATAWPPRSSTVPTGSSTRTRGTAGSPRGRGGRRRDRWRDYRRDGCVPAQAGGKVCRSAQDEPDRVRGDRLHDRQADRRPQPDLRGPRRLLRRGNRAPVCALEPGGRRPRRRSRQRAGTGRSASITRSSIRTNPRRARLPKTPRARDGASTPESRRDRAKSRGRGSVPSGSGYRGSRSRFGSGLSG